MLYIACSNTNLRLAITILRTGEQMTDPANVKLQRAIDDERDHVRGSGGAKRVVNIVYYGDFLCASERVAVSP